MADDEAENGADDVEEEYTELTDISGVGPA
jgi:predicted flap endonuclease-1-like 5' DNA nuclease